LTARKFPNENFNIEIRSTARFHQRWLSLFSLGRCQQPMETSPPLPVARSAFVTTVAWVFIALAGFATLISILQNVMIYTFFPLDQMHAAMAQAREQQQMPAFTLFMFEHIRELFTGFLVVTSGTLIISIGLLRRHNWARILFVTLLVLGIIWNIGGLFWQWFFFRSIPQPPQTPAQVRAQFETMFIVMGIFSVIMALGMSVLFGWIIKRLTSTAIKNEFVTPTA
jgi:hypothetical protein